MSIYLQVSYKETLFNLFITFYLHLKQNAGAFRSPPHPFGIKKDKIYEKILKIDFRDWQRDAAPLIHGLVSPIKLFPGTAILIQPELQQNKIQIPIATIILHTD